MGGLWLIKNFKVISALVLLFSAMAASYHLKATLCALEIAKLKQSIVDARTVANEKQRLEAEKLARQTREIYILRSEINRRALDAKDPSFGCIVNDDGLQLLRDAKSTANAGRGGS